ncbi:hypothetical protein PoB_001701800 [Plakobranchus ocellatus]|uniref:Secreted protein n=1 Tax=Plakobranchus ocellatus TaxID=259542 RepID=A0AAV3Z733_9GAST|nr:hypothetical protein PoB_001701800 [Plakobranchus ocellatus]
MRVREKKGREPHARCGLGLTLVALCQRSDSVENSTPTISWGVGGTVASESALRSTGTLLPWVRAPPPAP